MVNYLRGKKSFQLDAKEFDALKKRLTGDELRRATKSGLRKAGRTLVSETERRFGRLVVKHKGKGKGRLSGLNHRGRVLKVASVKVFDNKKQLQPMATVSIRNRRTDYRAQFFELGTKRRYTKRPYKAKRGLRGSGRHGKYYPSGMYRGVIREGRYFRRAQQASERQVFTIMEQSINGHIIRQANKK